MRVTWPCVCMRTCCASRSAGGARNSPARKVATASGIPTRMIEKVIWVSDAPEVRITVYSEFATSCAMANRVPISAAVGTSS